MKMLLPILIALASTALPAQVAVPQGGGEVAIAGTTYRFEPTSLLASTQPVEGHQALKLTGRLIPADPSGTLDLEMVCLDGHVIYLLNLVRHDGASEKMRWSANLKTRLKVAAPEHPEDGDRATFQVEGPLVRMENGKVKRATWLGTFWSAFTVEQVP